MVATNCRFLTGYETESEDLAQEVFIKAYFSLRGFEERAQFRTWIQKIKVNHCLNHLRGRKGRNFTSIDSGGGDRDSAEGSLPGGPLAHESHAAALQAKVDVDRVLHGMPDTLRLPLILCDLDGYSYQEAADELEIGMSTLKMRLKRARSRFREVYSELTEAPLAGAAVKR